MLCEKCNLNTATVFQTFSSNQKEREFFLCVSCAQQHKKTDKFKLFSSPKSTSACKCGTTIHDILQSGYVGCADCYSFFSADLKSLITALHAKPYHTGKKKLSKLELYTLQLEKAKQNNFHTLAEKLILKIEGLKGGEHGERV